MDVTRGGALVEGIALASRRWRVVAARQEGLIFVATREARFERIRRIPVFRGLVSFLESPTDLAWSALVADPDNPPSESPELPEYGWRSPIGVVLALLAAHGLPTAAVYGLARSLPFSSAPFQAAVFAIQLVVFIVYIRLVARFATTVNRVFGYAGAFKMALWQMTHPRASLREHPRWHWQSFTITIAIGLAGTAAVVPHLDLGGPTSVLARVALTPFAIAIAEELQRGLTKLGHGPATRIVFAPLKLVDQLCTGVPDDGMLEVAAVCLAKLTALEKS